VPGSPRRATYSSTLRADQAHATRRAVVEAASRLFVQQGYAATTIDAVAAGAGVSRKTVFSAVGGKGALLKRAWDVAIAGDDEPVPMAERPAVAAMQAERDPERLVRMWVDMQLEVGSRAAPLGAALLAAADVDDEVRELREVVRRESLVGARAFVTHLHGVGGLRSGLGPERAADVCWAVLNSMLLSLLVGPRRWSLAEYGDWLVTILRPTLLGPDPVEGSAPVEAVTPVAAGNVTVEDDGEGHRYVARLDGREIGTLSYEPAAQVLVLVRTDADPVVGDALVRRAVDDVRASGRRLLAVCPFVAWWLGRHPEAATLVGPTPP
jgi:AcrR family transcriptional regulator/predicted GNAT family acetyltransferase